MNVMYGAGKQHASALMKKDRVQGEECKDTLLHARKARHRCPCVQVGYLEHHDATCAALFLGYTPHATTMPTAALRETHEGGHRSQWSVRWRVETSQLETGFRERRVSGALERSETAVVCVGQGQFKREKKNAGPHYLPPPVVTLKAALAASAHRSRSAS